jgi:formylmethanofuran dehydrogenase subunit E
VRRDIPKYEDVVLFHSHKCSTLALWYRMSLAAMNHLDCGRTDSGELISVVNHDSCGLDAVQMITGCTFGNGNLIIRSSSSDVLTLYDTASEHGVRVVPTLAVDRERNTSSDPVQSEEEKTNQILRTPDEELLICTDVPVSPWDIARLQTHDKCKADFVYNIASQSSNENLQNSNGNESWLSQQLTTKKQIQA